MIATAGANVTHGGGTVAEGGAAERRNGRSGVDALGGQDHSGAVRRLRVQSGSRGPGE